MIMKILLALVLVIAHLETTTSCLSSGASSRCSTVASKAELCGTNHNDEIGRPPLSEIQKGIRAAMTLRNDLLGGKKYVRFMNREKRLPLVSGNTFYVEGDVNNVRPRDAKRVVIQVTKEGDCHMISNDFYYTNDHYKTFHPQTLC